MKYASLAWVARALQPHRESITTALINETEQTMSSAGDIELRDLLAASTTENVVAVLNAMANSIDPATVVPPPATIAYARRLAREGRPLSALLRAYAIGQARMIAAPVAVVLESDTPDKAEPIALIMDFAAVYVDRITAQVGETYETERDRWLNRRHAARREWVQRLIEDEDPDVAAAEDALGYQLNRLHLAAEVWTAPATSFVETARALEQATQLLAEAAGAIGPALMLPTGDRDLRLWLPVNVDRPCAIDRLTTELAESLLPVRMTLGSAHSGLTGFRLSARAAARAKTLALAAGDAAPKVVSFESIAPFALLVDEPEELASLIRRVLGSLAHDDDKTELLRDTLEVFLAEGGSYARTAAKLLVHRNTVQYRIQRVTGKHGVNLTGDTFDLRFALGVCRWHRRAALVPPTDQD
ncbi:helix-turn-helix domain-containing protein [Nocardia sp. NPDC051030]|uniref:PucR family transcriptional regulator n=1 Tax=Nocardia sp. NPDC051030 TaxID=3155162 RepID=UPI00342FCC85